MAQAAIDLEQGNRYPFDATDAWWHSGMNGTPKLNSTSAPYKTARGILHSLQDRDRFVDVLTGIPENVRKDIITSLAKIIERGMLPFSNLSTVTEALLKR